MKRTLLAILAIISLLVAGCSKEYDDSKLKKRVNDLEARVSALEALNTTVAGIGDIVTALGQKDYVTGVIEVKDDKGTVIGYTISFSKSNPVTVYHGQKGDKGELGQTGPEGPQGPVPSVGVQLGEDGLYYWTVEGELLKDADGKPVPCTSAAPVFKIEDGSWWISYDGSSWEKLGLISDTGTTVDVDNSNEDYVLLTINGTEVRIPKEKAFSLKLIYGGDITAVGASAYTTIGVEYEVVGAGENDDVTVDILNTSAGITAQVAKVDNLHGLIAINTSDVVDGKVFVYADNNKGKTNIKSITLEAGQIADIAPVAQAEAEGGTFSLTVETNYEAVVAVPDGIDWVHVAKKTKASQGNYIDQLYVGEKTKGTSTYEYEITVDPNTTSGYRFSYIGVIDFATGNVIKLIDLVQKPAEGVTDLASISKVPDNTKISVNGAVVLAAGKRDAVISDGLNTIHMKTMSTLAVGDSISVLGVKMSNEKASAAYVVASSVNVLKQGVKTPDSPWRYIVYAQNYVITNTGTTALLQKDDDGYFFYAPMRFEVRIESPLDGLNLDAYVGKYVTLKGYIDEVEMGEFDWDTFTFAFDYKFIVNTVEEVNFVKKANWTLKYIGRTDEYPGFPESFSTTVTGEDNEHYIYTIFTEEKLQEFPIEEEAGIYGAIMAADDLQYTLSTYALQYSKEVIYNDITCVGSSPNFYEKFEPGIYYVVIGGVDTDGYATGSYAVDRFEIEDPHVAGTYDAFLGTWKYTTVLGDSQKWVISEKEAGQSYYLCVDGVSTESGNLPVLSYDKENGTAVLEMQELGEYEKDGKTCLERIGTLYTFDDVEYYDNSRYMGDNTLVFTARLLNDGTIDIVPGEDTSSQLEGFAIMTGDKEDSYDCNIVGSITPMPGVLEAYKASAPKTKASSARRFKSNSVPQKKAKSAKRLSYRRFQ
ncbi:MAG: hypothetical protein J5520_04980 [Bacteroidales bacterium]|nr:hypothetical protein [Bacteroidales bacterium]